MTRPAVATLLCTALLCSANAFATTTAGTDWQQPNLVTHGTVIPHWSPDGNSFWYRTDGSKQSWIVDARSKQKRPATDAESAAFPTTSLPLVRAHPSRASDVDSTITFINRLNAPVSIEWIDLQNQSQPYGSIAANGRRTLHTFAGHVWRVMNEHGDPIGAFEAIDGGGEAMIDSAAGDTTKAAQVRTRRGRGKKAEIEPDRPNPNPQSPDGRFEASVRDGNVFVRDRHTGAIRQFSTDASADAGYDAGSFCWSPDSRHLVALRTVAGQNRQVYEVQSSPPDQLQPKLLQFDYPKPGDKLAVTTPHLFDAVDGDEVKIDRALFPEPLDGDGAQVRWAADSRRFTFFYCQRGHQLDRIIAVDAATGAATPIVDEHATTFIDSYTKTFFHFISDEELIWMSERDGCNHLFLYNAKTGRAKNTITNGNFVVRGVERIDTKRRQVWFTAGGIDPKQDPYYLHYCRVNFDGTGLVDLTPGDGTHTVRYSPNGDYLIDTYSRVDLPPVNELRRSDDGELLVKLEAGDASKLLATGWRYPERFVVPARDGRTPIYGILIRPTNFDPSKKYPVIENIYAGPHGAFVPKPFGLMKSDQELANLGFIVVHIDGMGTSFRSKAFQDVCWHNLQDAGFPDRIRWIKAAAAKHPELDLSHGVGIFGTSAGGQNALDAVELHADFYTAAVADCGCYDNRMDKASWNEQWMGWPVGPWYAEQSNVVRANEMNGALLLIVGELDHNVDPASTMQVVHELIKADKDFDLLVIPNADHGQDGDYGARRRRDFFVQHLLTSTARR